MNYNNRSIIACFCAGLMGSTMALAGNTAYCTQQGGTVETMLAEFDTHAGHVEGFKKKFCTFNKNGGFVAVGLQAFSSKAPNIAASLIKTLPPLKQGDPLFKGKYANPSVNVCKNLGGASISFNVMGGGFTNALGQSDICVFGDGSMVSGWSLIYMANGRDGYDEVKNAVRSEPMSISW